MPHARILPTQAAPARYRMFANRAEAGRQLAQALMHHARTGAVVLGLPRGGVVVAAEVARALDATLDVWVVRKIGAPYQPELGMGAIAEGDAVVLDRSIVSAVGVSRAELLDIARREGEEVRRRVQRFRGDRPAPELRGKTVIIVDDGIATGGTTRAALRGVRQQAPARVVLAVPVASPIVLHELREECDEIVCLSQPESLYAIGLWYEDFTQVEDAEVIRLLGAAARPSA